MFVQKKFRKPKFLYLGYKYQCTLKRSILNALPIARLSMLLVTELAILIKTQTQLQIKDSKKISVPIVCIYE